MAAKSLKGSKNMAPIILNTTPSVNPTIAKGRSRSQTKINKKNKPIANGQHNVKRIQKSSTAIKSFIAIIFYIYI
jgi:hypothetical protein